MAQPRLLCAAVPWREPRQLWQTGLPTPSKSERGKLAAQMCRGFGMLVALVPTTAAQAAGDPAPYYTCASQVEFIGGANSFIHGICCTQGAETCGRDGYPFTCGSPACARAVKMVGDGCLDWLAEPEQAMLASGFATPLKTLVDTCNATQPAENTVLLTASSTTLTGTTACGATIIDGRAESPNSWSDALAVSAPPGMTATITVQTLWLPDGDALEIRDGDNFGAPRLARLQETTKPEPTKYTASGQDVFLRMLSDGTSKGKGVGFSLLVGCTCSADGDACSAHGSCRDGACVCVTGWMGPTCATADPCSSSPCQHGGTCTVVAAATHRSLSEHPSAAPCDASQLQATTAEINEKCCGADDATCVHDMPRSW
eukprot:COSAG05_NODE_5388_length_1190_cov_1.645280_1_plen_372_part_00